MENEDQFPLLTLEIREQTQCEAEQRHFYPSPGSKANKPKCNPDGSYFEQQTDYYGNVICVTPWSGSKKWLMSEKPCDTKIIADTKCRQEAAKILEDKEQMAKMNVQIMDRNAKSCQNDGRYDELQYSMIGVFCVDEESGEYIGRALRGDEGYEC